MIKVRKIHIPATLKRGGQMIVRCLGCGVMRVVSRLRPGDTHICKDCGRRSVIKRRVEGALEGIESVNMMRKGQIKRLDGRDSAGQSKFIESLFGVAA